MEGKQPQLSDKGNPRHPVCALNTTEVEKCGMLARDKVGSRCGHFTHAGLSLFSFVQGGSLVVPHHLRPYSVTYLESPAKVRYLQLFPAFQVGLALWSLAAGLPRTFESSRMCLFAA